LKKPAKTREELESAIRLEMEDICEWPTDLAISVAPHEDTWKAPRRHLESRDRDGWAARCGSMRHDRNDCKQIAHPVRLERLTTRGKEEPLKGRQLTALGHDVRLIPVQYVKPFQRAQERLP
jgi:hypothetical protein